MRIICLLTLAVGLALGVAPQTSNSPSPKASPAAESLANAAPPKLRRLHLVRPDLIYYPLPSEYLC